MAIPDMAIPDVAIPRVVIPMIVGMLLAGIAAAPGTARAQAAPGANAVPDGGPDETQGAPDKAPDAPPSAPEDAPDNGPAPATVRVTSLDGTYLMLGPVAAFVRADEKWDGGFGGEIAIVRVRERDRLASLGIAVGAMRLALEERGRLWAEVMAGTRLAGIHAGLGVGGGVEIDAEQGLGTAHATVWIFAGVVPYARVGMVEGDGPFAEIGIQVALPAVDF